MSMLRAYYTDLQRDERPEIRPLSDTVHTARIVHIRCIYCRQSIQPGEEYRRLALVVDGDISIEKSHTAACTDGW